MTLQCQVLVFLLFWGFFVDTETETPAFHLVAVLICPLIILILPDQTKYLYSKAYTLPLLTVFLFLSPHLLNYSIEAGWSFYGNCFHSLSASNARLLLNSHPPFFPPPNPFHTPCSSISLSFYPSTFAFHKPNTNTDHWLIFWKMSYFHSVLSVHHIQAFVRDVGWRWLKGWDTDAVVPSGDCNTMLDARQQMQPTDVTRRGVKFAP